MPKRNLAEYLLGSAVGRTRATVIYGDLVELAAARGRAWFWAAYTRTLVSLIWRTPAAFFVACGAFTVLYKLAEAHPSILIAAMMRHSYTAQVVLYLNFQLWFVVPFAALTYGIRDRFVQLSCATALLGGCAYPFLAEPRLTLLLAAGVSLATAALLISVRWRRALLALGATSSLGVITLFNLCWLAHLGCWLYAGKPLNATSHYEYLQTDYAFPYAIFWTVTWSIALLNMLVVSGVSTRLHGRDPRKA